MNRKKLILTSGIANSFEWYDYALFGHFAPIIGAKFFPSDNPSVSLLQAFLVFAVGYLMRPIGGIFFGVIGDRFGRKIALSSAIMCMALPTAAIAFLPTYDSWGLTSTILMIMVRMLQGLSMGGALTGSISFIIEHTPKNKRGLLSSISMASICIGILLGSLTAYSIKAIFSEAQFEAWAWRLPFILGIAIYFVGIYVKEYTAETPLFKQAKYKGEVEDSPLRKVVKKHWRDIAISIFINATGSIIFYLEAIYLISYLKITRNFSETHVTILSNLCFIIMILVILLAGWLSDRVGRRKIFVVNLLCIIVFITPILYAIENGSFTAVCVAQLLIAIMAALYIGPEPALQAELYPLSVRNTGLSISYNIATSVFGGTAPYFIEKLIQDTGTITSSVYYIIATAILGLVALYFYRDRSNNI